MKASSANRLGTIGYITLFGVLFGPPVGGFLFGIGLLALLFLASMFNGNSAPDPSSEITSGKALSGLGSILGLPFATAFAAYIPGAPTAVLTGLTTGIYVWATGKISRLVIWGSSLFSAIAILLIAYSTIQSGTSSFSMKIAAALYCVLSVATADFIYRVFGRHMSIPSDIEITDKNALIDSIRKAPN